MYPIQPDSIEKWAKQTEIEFGQLNQKPLTKEQTEIFFKCYMNEQAMEDDEDLKTQLEKNKAGYASVFYNRVRCCHTYEVSNAVCLFMSFVIQNFGDSTIYANYLQYYAFKHNVKKVDMNFISTKVFPYGFPNKVTLQKVWDDQKVERNGQFTSDNLLDYAECQESITIKRDD